MTDPPLVQDVAPLPRLTGAKNYDPVKNKVARKMTWAEVLMNLLVSGTFLGFAHTKLLRTSSSYSIYLLLALMAAGFVQAIITVVSVFQWFRQRKEGNGD